MSGAITLNKPAGGAMTIEAENGTSSETITIPKGGTGKILQAVTASHPVGSTSVYMDDAIPLVSEGVQTLSLNITPTSASSKILIMVNMQTSFGHNNHGVVALFRGSTLIQHRKDYSGSTSSAGSLPFSMECVDSPNTTSQVTYNIRVGTNNTGSPKYYGRSYNVTSSYEGGHVTLLEVAA